MKERDDPAATQIGTWVQWGLAAFMSVWMVIAVIGALVIVVSLAISVL